MLHRNSKVWLTVRWSPSHRTLQKTKSNLKKKSRWKYNRIHQYRLWTLLESERAERGNAVYEGMTWYRTNGTNFELRSNRMGQLKWLFVPFILHVLCLCGPTISFSLFSSILFYPEYSSTFHERSINGDEFSTAPELTQRCSVVVTQISLLSHCIWISKKWTWTSLVEGNYSATVTCISPSRTIIHI